MTTMLEVKTAELEGAALDWAVAMVEGVAVKANQPGDMWPLDATGLMLDVPRYSTDWRQCGPLIDKYCPLFTFCRGMVRAEVLSGVGMGDTYLIAICRAILIARLGDAVQVPAELVGGGV